MTLQQRSNILLLIAAISAIGLGVLVRTAHVLSQDFPLNDGALFYTMIRDLQQASYQLPTFSSYNAAHIPFSYSPLGFYIAGLLNDITPLSLITLVHWLPLIVTSMSVPAFFFLARALLSSTLAAIIAVLAFGLLPRSFIWLIMGGGLTRSFGFLFALLALYQLYLLYTQRKWRYAGSTSLCIALTIVSHLGTLPFVVVSSLLFFLSYGRHKHGLLSSVCVALGSLALTAPWWVSVFAIHGLAPFLAASATGGSIFSMSWAHIPIAIAHARLGTSEPIFPLIGVLALLGVFAALLQRRYLLPLWWLMILVADTRSGTTFASIPISMLATLALLDVLLPIWKATQSQRFAHHAAHTSPIDMPAISSTLMLGGLLCFLVASALTSNPAFSGELRDLSSLSKAERLAMQWVARSAPRASQFLVLSGTAWEVDRTSEWFPVLAERQSVATVQGYEWVAGGAFEHQRAFYNWLQECGRWTSECLANWSRKTRVHFTHVYVPKPPNGQCCELLLASLREDRGYRLLYDGPGATVFARHSGPETLHGAMAGYRVDNLSSTPWRIAKHSSTYQIR